jgi:hypothetical protein
MNARWRIAYLLPLAAVVDQAWAHHSYAAFDLTRQAALHGTVKALEWTNPHVWIWIEGDDGSGQRAMFAFETVSPGELERFFGWSKASLSVGDAVTVQYAPLRSGSRGGALKQVALADGRVLETPAAKIGPPAPAAGNPRGGSNENR